jgi:hypothetical protein
LPAIWNLDSARSAAEQGVAAAVLIAVANLVFAGLVAWGIKPLPMSEVGPEAPIIASAMYVALACGIHAMSRVAAVLGLLLYLGDRVMLWGEIGPRAGGTIISVFLALMFANAVRGTFAYRGFTRVGAARRSDDM